MTTTNIDIGKICPELAELAKVISEARTLWGKTCLCITAEKNIDTIAAQMLKLAEDLEEAKSQTLDALIEKIAKARVEAAMKRFIATRKGDPADE